MTCKKCFAPSAVTLRKKDYYCKDCFLSNTNHKFRACIGKNKILSSNEKVLVCLSGGAGSTVLVDLIYNGICLDSHKKLRIVPYFLHLIGVGNDHTAISVIEYCKKYNLNVLIVHISDYIQDESKLPDNNTIPNVNSANESQFWDMLNSLSSTSYNDFLTKIKRNLFTRYANLLECNFIFTAETTTCLAINLLSNIAIGRGTQVENDIGFLDNRDEKPKILRPMKDISMEELDYYLKLKELIPVYYSDTKNNSLQSLIKNFVVDLQENFQSTISTVCKTADKIGVYDDQAKCDKCLLCKSDLSRKDAKLSALEATNFSRTVSFLKPDNDNKRELIALESFQNSQPTQPIFPYIHKYFCYGCSRNYSEISLCKFPNHIKTIIQHEVTQ